MRQRAADVFPGGVRYFIGFLTFIGSFAPLSTDLYLPAMPEMTAQFAVTPDVMGLTLSGFLLSFALSMLVWGPFSDKYGRRPVLLAGAALYIFSCLALAVTESITPLIVWRCVQGAGSGALSAVSLALVKDVFRGPVMAKVITIIQTIHVLAPMLAPVLGGGLLLVASWRGIFWVQAVCGGISLCGACFLRETLATPLSGSPLAALGRIAVVLSDRGFRHLVLLFSAVIMPFMAYLGISAYVFQSLFAVSPQQFSAFFAGNAAISMLGPLCYMHFFHAWNQRRFIAGAFVCIALGGCVMLAVGDWGPWWFALCFVPVTFASSAMRPPSTVLMMRQLAADSGTVSALIGSMGLLFGSLSMMLCALPFWPGLIVAAAVICLIIGGGGLLWWLWQNAHAVFRP